MSKFSDQPITESAGETPEVASRLLRVAAWLAEGRSRAEVYAAAEKAWGLARRTVQQYVQQVERRLAGEAAEADPLFELRLAQLQRERLFRLGNRFLRKAERVDPAMLGRITGLLTAMGRLLDGRDRAAAELHRQTGKTRSVGAEVAQIRAEAAHIRAEAEHLRVRDHSALQAFELAIAGASPKAAKPAQAPAPLAKPPGPPVDAVPLMSPIDASSTPARAADDKLDSSLAPINPHGISRLSPIEREVLRALQGSDPVAILAPRPKDKPHKNKRPKCEAGSRPLAVRAACAAHTRSPPPQSRR